MEKDRDKITNWLFLRSSIKTFAKTVKPWKKNWRFEEGTLTGEYVDGWNDAVKEMKKNEDKWFKHMDKNFKER